MTDTWTWATVTQATPLRIKVDGDTAALDATTGDLVGSLAVDDRVRFHLHADGIIVTGLQGGAGGGGTPEATAATANTLALRDGDGQLKAADGVAADDVATVAQLTIPSASTTVSGIVELATDAETATGTDATRAVTPAGLSTFGTVTAASGYTLGSITNLAQVGKIVVFTFRVEKTDGSNLSRYTTLATIPAGFRPDANLTFGASAVKSGVDDYVASALVTSGGSLMLIKPEGGAAVNRVEGSGSWII